VASEYGTAFAPAIRMTSWINSLASGAAGAVTLTVIHELARRRIPYAPRMDLVAMRGLRRIFPPLRQASAGGVHKLALAGDLVSNSLYYAAIPAGTHAATWRRAALLGAGAGAGALLLPEPMGLGTPPHSDRRANETMTMAWYMAGALVTAAVATALARQP
jgi:hypothetical protein